MLSARKCMKTMRLRVFRKIFREGALAERDEAETVETLSVFDVWWVCATFSHSENFLRATQKGSWSLWQKSNPLIGYETDPRDLLLF